MSSSGSRPPSSIGMKRGSSVNVAAVGIPETVHEQVQSTLRIGDTVLLFSQEGQGFVYSDVSSETIQSIVVHPTAPSYQWGDPHFLPNIQCACFKVLNANKYKAQNRLKELKERIAQWKSGGKDPKQLQELKQALKNAERNADAERADNELDQKRLEGQEVLYGNMIQLQHAFTGKYLTINSSATSLLESTNLRTELTRQNSPNCMFKILPRYKVRSVGDEVRTYDQVMFESVKTEGQFLHCSVRCFEYIRQHLHSECKELNLSASESAFTVCLHSHPQPENKMDLLRAGGTIRLFHREIECYLVAEGSFAERPEGQVVENVHLRKRKSDHGKLKPPSTSAITYWTIEKKKEPLSGEPVLWYERCRIRHLLTQQYLAVERREGQNVLTLKESKPGLEFDQDTQFRLFPVISGEDEIKYGTYARINHPHTKTWLHASKGVVYQRKSFDPAATGLQGLRWDDAEVFEATAIHQMAYDDAFTLMEVEDKLVHKFNLVAGYVPVLKEYKEDRKQQRPLTDKKAKLTSRALGELSRFMLDAYARQKDHQKLVRNLRILEQLVEFLKLYKADAKDADHQRRVCRACYRIIEVFLQGDSRKNELYVSRFVPFFEGQMRLGLNAEDMLIELVRDNPNIVSRFSVEQIDRIVEHILKMEDKDCRMLDYLGVACVCEDKATVPSQNHIVKQLLQKHGRKLFFITEVLEDHTHPDNPRKVFYQDKTGEMKSLTEIAHKRINRDEQKCTSTYRWLESQLDLFGRLAKGNNPSAIHTITEGMHFITFDEALVGANDPELHPSIRSKYVELVRVLFVDVGNNRAVLDSLPNSFVYREVKENPVEETEGDAAVALTGVANPHFGAMREWILKVVKTNTRLVCADSHIGENLLLAQILGVLELLVKYGYYDDPKDIETLLEPFLSMLSGLNDTPGVDDKAVETFQEMGRLQDTLANRAVFEVKKKIMEVCDLFFNYRFYLRLQRFAYDYRCLKGDIEQGDAKNGKEGEVAIQMERRVVSPSGASTPERRTHGRGLRLPIALTVGHSTPPRDLKELETASLMVHEDEWLMKVARERLKHIFKSTAFFEGTDSDPRKHEFVKTLLDIAGYDNNDLVVLALHLLNRYFSMESDLFEKATESQLLTTPSSIAIQKLVEERVALFRQICLHDLDVAHMRKLELILEQMTKLCMLDEDLEEPHEQNQKILYNHGVLSDVLNLLFDRLNSRADASQMEGTEGAAEGEATAEEEEDKEDSEDVMETLFARCFKFLVALARGNRVVKEHLFNRMDSLLAIGQAVPEMAKLLCEVFTNFQEVCLRVEESQIEEVFRIMNRVNGEAQAELLQMLRALTNTKVNEIYLPLKRNQAFIIKFYSKNRELFERVLGQEEGKKRQRLELLEDDPDNSDLLLLLLNTTDVLASCCEGTNPFIESICQTIFSVEELLEYLCNDNIVPERKRPFCRFLVWVYLGTNSEAASQLNLYSTNEKMLLYLRQSMEMVSGLADALRGVPASNRTSVRRQLKRTRSDIQEVRRKPTMRQRVKSMVHSVARVTSDTGELAVGILPYFMDGILPLFKVFYQQYLAIRHDVDDDEMLPIMGEVACVLMGMVEVITPFLSNSDQAVLLRDCLLQLTSSPVIDQYLVVSAEVHHRCEEFIQNATDTKSEAMKKFEANYEAELKLNADFNAYVRGYELAYNGPNTIRHQLDLKGGQYLDKDYSEFLDADMKVRGDEYLPLGPSFQGFVSCFISREGHQPKVLGSTRHLIRLLDISFNHLELQTEAERVRQDLLDAKCLQILRAIIHNEIRRIDPELKENEPEKYRRMATNIERVQNSIQELGDNPIASIVPMLAHHNDATAAEVLAFLSVFLYDGNEMVQAGFAYLTQTREERFFVNIRKRLNNAVAIDTERRALVSQFHMKQADNKKLYDSYLGRTAKQRKSRGASMAAAAESSLMAGEETQRSTDVLATVPEKDEDGEAHELDTFGEEEHDGPAHDKSTAPLLRDATLRRGTLLSRRFSGLEAEVEGPDPNRWILSDIFRQKREEVQVKQAEMAEKEAAESKKSKGADSDELRFQDSTYVELALRVLGLMCDGQNRTLQNYLRLQPDNINNVNLVGEVAHFLQHFYSDINQDNIELVNRIIQTLVEMCVGNYYNQDVIFDRQIVDIINRILQTSFFPGCKIAEAMQLKASAVELLEVMLEDTHKKSPELAQNIHKALDVSAMFHTLVYFYRLRDDPYLKDQQKDDDAERAMFRVFHVLRHLADFEGISREKVEATKPKPKKGATKEDEEAAQDTWDAWKYCMDRSKSVEVLYENLEGEKILSRLHFHYQPDDELPEEIIEKVKWSVNRDSAEDKVRDYLAWMKAVKREVIHVNQLREHWFTHMFIYKAQYQHWALVFLTLILNILVLISWKGPDALGSGLAFEIRTTQLNFFINNTDVIEQAAQHLPIIPLVEEWFGYFALFILGAVHLVMTIMQVLAYFLVNWPNFYYIPEFVYRLRGKERKNASYSDIPFFGLRTVYYLLFLSCSILSLCFWGYFYSICLMHIVVNNDILQRVLRSVTKNGKSLLWVAALGAVVLYIYAVIAYAGYQMYFDDPGNSSHCKTLFECVVSVFRLGLLNGALVTNGDSIFREDNEALVSNFGLYIPRTIFDLTFFIIVTTVGLNIVFGIIVDTFSELRDERYKTEADKKGFCFICHIAAYEFERRADGFDHHTRCEHNMWDYIYLCLELDRIDSSDQNAIQQYVSQQIEDDSTSFFPTLRARCLKDEQDTTKEEIAELKDMMAKILDKLKEKRTPGLDQDEDDHSSTWETSSVRDGVSTPPPTDV